VLKKYGYIGRAGETTYAVGIPLGGKKGGTLIDLVSAAGLILVRGKMSTAGGCRMHGGLLCEWLRTAIFLRRMHLRN